YGYINYVGLDKFKVSLVETSSQINKNKKTDNNDLFSLLSKDDEKDPFRVLFHHLNISARPGNMPLAALSTSSGQGPKPHLLLIAYIDYFTRYRIQSKQEFAKVFGVTHGKVTGTFHDLFNTYIDLYWAQAKDKVRSSVTLFDAE